MSTDDVPTETPAAQGTTEKKAPKEKKFTLTDAVSEAEFCYNVFKAFPKDKNFLFDTLHFSKAMGASENQFKKHLQRLQIKDPDFKNLKPTMSTTLRKYGAVTIQDVDPPTPATPVPPRPKPRPKPSLAAPTLTKPKPGPTPPTPIGKRKRKNKDGDDQVSKFPKVCRHDFRDSCDNCDSV